MKISVICVYNDENTYKNDLLSSLNNQDIDYELIGINNIDNKFKSAASALNYGASIASGDILVFSHQDIYLKTSDALRKFSNSINELPVNSIVGSQGVRDKSKVYYSNITYDSLFIKELDNTYKEENIEVSCVDEGFFGMKKETWLNHNFNELLCSGWHLYCVEQCLYNRSHNGHVYVYPIQLHHFSMGTITIGYMNNLQLLCKVYRKDFKYIWTTCYKVSTNPIYINSLRFIWILNRKLRGRKL